MSPRRDPEAEARRRAEEALLDEAWEALEEGELDRALELAGGLSPELRGGWVLRACALVELEDLPGARDALERAEGLASSGEDADLWFVRGEIALREWRLEDARAALERLVAIERSPSALARLALCLDLCAEPAGADRLLAEAHRLDPESWSLPPRLDEQAFGRVLERAIAELPAEFRAVLDEVPILVDPVPSRELARGAELETPVDLLGLFVGPSRLERSHEDSLAMPAAIHLFQRNLERAAKDEDELVEEIRVTLYHEVAHLLGFDEEGVAGMGLE